MKYTLLDRARRWEAIRKFEFIIPNQNIDKILTEFSFSVSKDLHRLKLTENKLRDLLSENHAESNTNLIGDLLWGNKDVGIRKVRLKKGKGKGKREGYRLITLVLSVKGKAYVLHVYDKKKKKKLSNSDDDNLKKILKSFPYK